MKKSLFSMLTNLPMEDIEWVVEQGSAYIKKNKNSTAQKAKILTDKQKKILFEKEYESYNLFK